MELRMMNIARAIVLFALFLIFGMSSAQARNCSNEALKLLMFEEVQVRSVKDQGKTLVDTIGILRNAGQEKVEGIRFVTRHLDAEQRLIDVQQDYLYGLTLVPGEDFAFRLVDTSMHPQSAYASHQTRVVAADCVPGEAADADFTASDAALTKAPNIGLLKWLQENWFPVLLLLFLVLSLFIGYRSSRGGSPVMRLLGCQTKLMERQIELIAQNHAQSNALIERIAKALEERNQS